MLVLFDVRSVFNVYVGGSLDPRFILYPPRYLISDKSSPIAVEARSYMWVMIFFMSGLCIS